MANFRVINDEGELASVRIAETVVLREELTSTGGTYINRALFIPKDTAGTYANRLHVICDEPGDYGVHIEQVVGIVNGVTGDCTFYTDDMNLSSTFFNGANRSAGVNLAVYDSFKLLQWEASPATALKMVRIVDSVNINDTASTPNTYLSMQTRFQTNKLACSVPIVIPENSGVFTAACRVLFSINDIDNKKVNLIWSIED